MLLHIENLNKHYGGVQALEDVSLSLEAGMIVGLVGSNGAGKSTLMKCITGAEIPDTGSIILNGQPVNAGDPHHSRFAGIEMVYQDLDLCLQKNAIFNIFLGREYSITLCGIKTFILDKIQMERTAHALIGQLNANIDIRKKVSDLSGGQQQAVAIARSLLHQPHLLILDEPTAALGVQETVKVLELIKSLKQQGMTIILISHKLSDIFEVADRVILMRHGKICEDKKISETSLQELTRKIIGS